MSINITPKQRVKISIEVGKEEQSVYVTGNMNPGLQNEIVRIEVTDPYGYCLYVNSTTGSGGSFNAQIDTSKPPSSRNILPTGHPAKFPIQGVYQVQARTINPPNAAQTKSNIVTMKLS